MRKNIMLTLIWVTCFLFSSLFIQIKAWPQSYEAYYLFLNEYPANEGTIYSDNFQGLTHDENNWFLSTNLADNNHPTLFKVPIQYDLRHVRDDLPDQYPGVIRVSLHTNLPPHLVWLGYHHFGDISYYQGFVLVPVEAQPPTPDAIFVFRSSDLSYIGRFLMPDIPLRPSCEDCNNICLEGHSLGWVAVDQQGLLYTTGDCVWSIHKFSVDWENVPIQPGISEYVTSLTHVAEMYLTDETGAEMKLGHTQGGDFSESGRLFYLLVGQIHDHDPNEGINVFDTSTWQRVRQSDNRSDPTDPFDYNFDPGWPYGEETEGLTVWDLDKRCGNDLTCAPGIRGQLHVGKADYEVNGYDVYIVHFTNIIDVAPPKTISWANDFVWDGARIRIQSGIYPENLTFSKRIEIFSKGGTVLIGTGQ